MNNHAGLIDLLDCAWLAGATVVQIRDELADSGYDPVFVSAATQRFMNLEAKMLTGPNYLLDFLQHMDSLKTDGRKGNTS